MHSAEGVNDRRDFLRLSAAAGLTAALGRFSPGARADQEPQRQPAPEKLPTAPKLERVRVGVVGVGGMGTNHIDHLLNVDGVDIVALCDIVPEKVARAQAMATKAGRPEPAGFSKGERDFERMCETKDLDLVYNVTPWEWHVPVCVAAMRNGKHVAVEVPAAFTLDGCWELVETAEKYGRHCVMLENCCYDRPELMVLNMVRQGVLGEPLHAEVGYQHDLRAIKFSKDGEGLWRRAHATKRNGNFYPTHGLGPAAQAMDVNRGDQFDYLVSMSGPSRGLQAWQSEHLAPDDPRRAEKYVLGDVNVSLIRTKLGRTIYVVHDTNLPRPYARFNLFQGTKGLYVGYPSRFHIEGRSPGHQWEPLDKFAAEFEHPLWKSEKVRKATGGHGGMDYLESYRLVECLRRGLPTDMNVYDAAAISCVTELSEKSVAYRSRPIDFPDFTRGRWQSWPKLEIVAAA